MILTPFDLKFHEKKAETPLTACRPLKKMKKNNVDKVDPPKVKKNNVDKEGPPPARAGGPGGGSPPARGKRGYIYVCIKNIYIYILIYMHIYALVEP